MPEEVPNVKIEFNLTPKQSDYGHAYSNYLESIGGDFSGVKVNEALEYILGKALGLTPEQLGASTHPFAPLEPVLQHQHQLKAHQEGMQALLQSWFPTLHSPMQFVLPGPLLPGDLDFTIDLKPVKKGLTFAPKMPFAKMGADGALHINPNVPHLTPKHAEAAVKLFDSIPAHEKHESDSVWKVHPKHAAAFHALTDPDWAAKHPKDAHGHFIHTFKQDEHKEPYKPSPPPTQEPEAKPAAATAPKLSYHDAVAEGVNQLYGNVPDNKNDALKSHHNAIQAGKTGKELEKTVYAAGNVLQKHADKLPAHVAAALKHPFHDAAVNALNHVMTHHSTSFSTKDKDFLTSVHKWSKSNGSVTYKQAEAVKKTLLEHPEKLTQEHFDALTNGKPEEKPHPSAGMVSSFHPGSHSHVSLEEKIQAGKYHGAEAKKAGKSPTIFNPEAKSVLAPFLGHSQEHDEAVADAYTDGWLEESAKPQYDMEAESNLKQHEGSVTISGGTGGSVTLAGGTGGGKSIPKEKALEILDSVPDEHKGPLAGAAFAEEAAELMAGMGDKSADEVYENYQAVKDYMPHAAHVLKEWDKALAGDKAQSASAPVDDHNAKLKQAHELGASEYKPGWGANFYNSKAGSAMKYPSGIGEATSQKNLELYNAYQKGWNEASGAHKSKLYQAAKAAGGKEWSHGNQPRITVKSGQEIPHAPGHYADAWNGGSPEWNMYDTFGRKWLVKAKSGLHFIYRDGTYMGPSTGGIANAKKKVAELKADPPSALADAQHVEKLAEELKDFAPTDSVGKTTAVNIGYLTSQTQNAKAFATGPQAKAWAASLTSHEKSSVEAFTTPAYRNINYKLTGKMPPGGLKQNMSDAAVNLAIKGLDGAFEKAPGTPDDMVVYRTVNAGGDYAKAWDNDGDLSGLGKWEGFASASHDYEYTKGWGSQHTDNRVMLMIKVPKGNKNIIPTESISTAGFEKELTINRNTPMKVVSKHKNADGMRVVVMEMQ